MTLRLRAFLRGFFKGLAGQFPTKARMEKARKLYELEARAAHPEQLAKAVEVVTELAKAVDEVPPVPAPAPVQAKEPTCAWCDEPFGDNRHPFMTQCHVECAVRMTSGSIAHLERRCGCFVKGATDHDPPDLTRRQAAMLAYRHVRGPAN